VSKSQRRFCRRGVDNTHPQKGHTEFCRSVRAVYGAPSREAAESAWDDFRERWSRYPGAVGTWGRGIERVWRLFSYGSEVRRAIYTTNALESVNASFRKVMRRGGFPSEGAVVKLLYPRVLELYGRWGRAATARAGRRPATSCRATRRSGRGSSVTCGKSGRELTQTS